MTDCSRDTQFNALSLSKPPTSATVRSRKLGRLAAGLTQRGPADAPINVSGPKGSPPC